jgi:hypothetical protein
MNSYLLPHQHTSKFITEIEELEFTANIHSSQDICTFRRGPNFLIQQELDVIIYK